MELALNKPLFSLGTKDVFKDTVRDNIKDTRTNLYKYILAEEGITYFENTSDVKSLQKLAKGTLSRDSYKRVEEKFKNTQKEIRDVLKLLDDETKSIPQKFFTKLYDGVISPAAKFAVTGMTSSIVYSALNLLPTPVRTISGVASLGILTYKGTKKVLEVKRAKKAKEYERIFKKLSATHDKNGKVIDTRLKDDEIEEVSKYLNKIGITLKTPNHENILESFNSLNDKNKLAVLNIINNQKGNPINISEEFKVGRKHNLKEELQTIMTITSFGLTAATAVNGVDETIISGFFNSLTAGKISEYITENKYFQAAIAATGGVGTKLSTYIPFIGEDLKNIFATESLIIGAGIGLAAGIVGAAGKLMHKGAKSLIGKAKDSIEENGIDKKDYSMYAEKKENQKELTETQQNIFNIIKAYMAEKGIEVKDEIKTIGDLKAFTKQLNKNDKKELNSILANFQVAMNKEDPQTKEKLAKAAKMLGNSFVYGSSAVLVKDILASTGLLPENLSKTNKEVYGPPLPEKINPIQPQEVYGPPLPEEVVGPPLPPDWNR